MSLQVANQTSSAKRKYEPPKLTVFGPLSKLTQNGTSATNENNGKGFCGKTFQKSGGTAC